MGKAVASVSLGLELGDELYSASLWMSFPSNKHRINFLNYKSKKNNQEDVKNTSAGGIGKPRVGLRSTNQQVLVVMLVGRRPLSHRISSLQSMVEVLVVISAA